MADGAAALADTSSAGAVTGGVAAERLRSFLERIERLEEDKQAIMGDMKEVYAEAKGEGYDTKIIRQIIRLRKMDRAERQEQEALLDLYLSALGEA
ncbi:MAG: DUF2312 domain-containing protein [Alphaproteobacteria bacterium]|nr:DUF2312 domain-containing protein [Alphaproteobacteria bacterium]